MLYAECAECRTIDQLEQFQLGRVKSSTRLVQFERVPRPVPSAENGAVEFGDGVKRSATNGQEHQMQSKISTPHHNVLCVGAEAGSPSTALTGGTDRSVRVWDLNTSKQLSALEGHSSKVESVASNDPNVLVSGSSEGIVLLWDKRQESEPTLIEVEGGRCSINSLSWMDGGSSQQFVVGCDSSDVLLFDLRQLGEPSSRLKGHTSSVTSVSASQYAVSAGLVVSCGSDNKVCIFDPTAETPQAVGNKSLCGHVDTPQAVAWHPTRKIVASVGYDCKLICHDLVATVTE